jgi:hypothetical protein
MAAEFDDANAMSIYLTGDGTPSGSLGGTRTAFFARSIAALIGASIPGIRVDRFCGTNATGSGTIYAASETELAYSAPGDSTGASVTIANGETKLLFSDDDESCVLVTSETTEDLGDQIDMTLMHPFNNVYGMANVDNADAGTGEVYYRGLIIKNDNATETISTIRIYCEDGTKQAQGREATAADAIQTIADDTTAPAAIAWNTGESPGAGRGIPNLTPGDTYGIWLRKTIAASTGGDDNDQLSWFLEYIVDGNTYTQTLGGSYRVEETALDLYEVYQDTDTNLPDFTTPVATNATLPIVVALAPAGAGTVTHKISTNRRNSYDLRSLNRYGEPFELDTSGNLVVPPLAAPFDVTLENTAGGMLQLTAKYNGVDDDPDADTWRLYITTTGVDPNPAVDTPTDLLFTRIVGSDVVIDGNFGVSGYAKLDHALGPYALSTDVRVIVRSFRVSDSAESDNTNVVQATVNTEAPGAVTKKRLFMGATNNQRQDEALI